jgi:hypothetical protein
VNDDRDELHQGWQSPEENEIGYEHDKRVDEELVQAEEK